MPGLQFIENIHLILLHVAYSRITYIAYGLCLKMMLIIQYDGEELRDYFQNNIKMFVILKYNCPNP